MKSLTRLFIAVIWILLTVNCMAQGGEKHTVNEANESSGLEDFLIKKDELILRLKADKPERKISFKNYSGDYAAWEKVAVDKFAELISYLPPDARNVTELRAVKIDGVIYHALVMQVSAALSVPAYLLEPEGDVKGAIMAIQGHGSVENVIGFNEDYHHKFGYELAKDGYLVLAPMLRGFSALSDLCEQTPVDRLDYWVSYSQFTLVTHLNLYGETLIGKTIEDLIAWENWLFDQYNLEDIAVAGISYGGDLALYYPVFSDRVSKIFSSGSLGSFSLIFSRCYNAPAHGVPGILEWLDRSDIAGLNAPRPIMLHYGELDTPSESNYSASYNESVEESVSELREIYSQEQAEDNISVHVTPDTYHEMDVELLKRFLNEKIH